MTVSSTVIKMPTYACDGATTRFDFTFLIWSSSEIKVLLRTVADGTEQTLTLTTDYTVTLSGSTPSAGYITTVSTYSSDYEIILKANFPLTQEVDYGEGDTFPAASHEEALDRGVRLSQQLNEMLDRVALLAETSSASGIVLPDPAALQYLRWNSGATNLENAELVIYGDLTAHNTATAPHLNWYATNEGSGPVVLSSAANIASGNSATEVVTPSGLKDFLGYETIFLPIGAFIAYSADPNAATIDSQNYPGQNKQVDYAKFGNAADWEAIDLRWALGPGWDISTLKLKYLWMPDYDTAPNNASAIQFGVQLKHIVDGVDVDTNHSTPPIYVSDTTQNEATGTEYISAATANVASGSLASENILDMRITRNNTISNNATAPVRLTGIMAMMRRNQVITEW